VSFQACTLPSREDSSITNKYNGTAIAGLPSRSGSVRNVTALSIPWTQELLAFQPLSSWEVWLVTLGMAFTAIVVNEPHK
jgi:hypothetical protein